MPETFDILVIGAGPGGHAAAVRAAKLGARAAIIERQGWGGTCTHRGCIPTKALLACSRRYAELKKLGRMGVHVVDPFLDFATLKRHQEQLVKISALGVQKSLKEGGVEMKSGEGQILSPGEVKWIAADGTCSRLSARNLVIAWGSEPALPPGVQPAERILTSDGLLSLRTLPESLLIVGGNVIGVEFATLMAELGVRVTLIEMMERILPGEEGEAAALLAQELKNLGVALHTGVRMETIRETGSGVQLLAAPEGSVSETLRTEGLPIAHSPGEGGKDPGRVRLAGTLELTAEYALICTGRRPRLNAEELTALGIRHNRRGIIVDERQMTSVPGIFAVGDITGGMMLAHRAMRQGEILAERLCGGDRMDFREEWIPSVVYTHPQIARVGLTEAEARRRGIAVSVRRADFAANITARTALLGPGFVKLLFHRDRLAGATIAGERAGELIASLSLAMAAGLDRRQLEAWIIPHPTLSEVLGL
ncbi:MAG: NAD(P)/FAD-dependent oxidoreductase [Deltaproteobacteria bacterium]|nr:NAD(P)/FAD-dependent oxidoreductase [Deltaproteobacteria bacterium]